MVLACIIAHFFDEITAVHLKDAVLKVVAATAIVVFIRVASRLMHVSIPFNVSIRLCSAFDQSEPSC